MTAPEPLPFPPSFGGVGAPAVLAAPDDLLAGKLPPERAPSTSICTCEEARQRRLLAHI